MSELNDLKASILEDGVIDADEAKQIKVLIMEDGVIDRDEADFLFELNDATSGKENAPEWDELFVSALSAHVLADDETPGVIDSDEADYLVAKIGADGEFDANEKALIANIAATATGIHENLNGLIEKL